MRIIVVIFAVLCSAGCQTAKLWKGTEGDEYVKIVPQKPDEDVEAALKGSGREFHCKELYYSTHPNNKVCYAKVAASENIQVKLLKTPETLVVDAGNVVKVFGYVLLDVVMHSGYHN